MFPIFNVKKKRVDEINLATQVTIDDDTEGMFKKKKRNEAEINHIEDIIDADMDIAVKVEEEIMSAKKNFYKVSVTKDSKMLSHPLASFRICQSYQFKYKKMPVQFGQLTQVSGSYGGTLWNRERINPASLSIRQSLTCLKFDKHGVLLCASNSNGKFAIRHW